MKVVKRDGRQAVFDKNKIKKAILKAFIDIDGEETTYAKEKAREIANYIESLNKKKMTVEEIQDEIVNKLMQSTRKDVAAAYVEYRYKRRLIRESNSDLSEKIKEKLLGLNIQNQNANVDEASFGGRKGEVLNEVMRKYALDNCVSETTKRNHLENRIYIHDLCDYAVGNHNCLSIPFDDLLSNGFNTRQTDVRPANSISTAFQLLAVIFQIQSLQQFGGVSATHLDWTMIPYVRKSFVKHWRDGYHYVAGCRDELDWKCLETFDIYSKHFTEKFPKVFNYAMDMTKRELRQAVEGMYHNLNTLQSRSGNQLPFTSINYGTCTLPEGRMVIEALIEGSVNGVGKFHRTSIFPCGIFQCMKGVNREEGDPNYDLFKLALKSTSQRLYPNYANVDWSGNKGYDKNDPKTFFSTMG